MRRKQMEGRRSERLPLRIPVRLILPGQSGNLCGITRNLSARDVYLVLFQDVQIPEEFTFVLELPPEITMARPMQVCCTGRTQRIESGLASGTGVAALIERCEFLSGPRRGSWRSRAAPKLENSSAPAC